MTSMRGHFALIAFLAFVSIFAPDGRPLLAQAPEGVPNPMPDLGDQFGAALALDATRLVVGAPGEDAAGTDAGAVHLFSRAALLATLLPDTATPEGAGFGAALALSPTRLAVGAPGEEGGGAVYLFRKGPAGAWAQEQRLLSPDPEPRGRFGASLALSPSGTLLVGAPTERPGGRFTGAVHVFERLPRGWRVAGRLEAPGVPSGGLFGASVDLRAGWAVVGSPFLGPMFLRGSAYLFRRTPEGWAFHQRLRPEDGSARDRFGTAVAFAGRRIVGGAPKDSLPPFGRFHSFESGHDPETRQPVWSSVQTEVSPTPTTFDRFGAALVTDGRRLVVGANADGEEDRGDAFLFLLEQGAWVPMGSGLAPDDLEAGARFGTSLALRTTTLAVGAPGASGGGSVFLYDVR